MRIIEVGSVGGDVANWQQFLITRQLDPGEADGSFGPLTETATKRFQMKADLTVDGIVGPATVAAAVPLGFQPSADSRQETGIAGVAAEFPTGTSDMIDSIIDIYHLNPIDFEKVKAAGIVAIIHKATQGSHLKDDKYQDRRARAKQLGFLWGAYHFTSGESPTDQADNFLSFAQPEDDELIALDFEPSSSGPDMTLEQAHRFIERVQTKLGRTPVIYGGSMLREAVGSKEDTLLAKCPLWYARYSGTDMPEGIPPQIWPMFTLWQYTDGDNGSEPRTVDGIGRCDRNRFLGTEEDLRAAWPLTKSATPAV
jgi:lysozyme